VSAEEQGNYWRFVHQKFFRALEKIVTPGAIRGEGGLCDEPVIFRVAESGLVVAVGRGIGVPTNPPTKQVSENANSFY
jgi:hypothetical protein